MCADVKHLFNIARQRLTVAALGPTGNSWLLNRARLEAAAVVKLAVQKRDNPTANFDLLCETRREMVTEQCTTTCPFIPMTGAEASLYNALFASDLAKAESLLGHISSVFDAQPDQSQRYA